MAPNTGQAAAGRSIEAIVDREGTRACAHAAALCRPDAAIRDLSDAIHAFCALHGTAPSIVERAMAANGAQAVQPWLDQAAAAFDHERRLLVTLAAAVGPIPSTPRHAQSQAAIEGQRHALATLAQSDRAGCALGAALALLLDWHAIRAGVLAATAERAGIALLPTDLPSPAAIIGTAQVIAGASAGQARALGFGADQLLAQHRGLWQLLAARAEARDAL